MSKPKILLQLDTDPQVSVFDSVVAIDAEVDHLLRHGGVTLDGAKHLVYGTIFTRGPEDLHRTAIFIGGSDVAAGEALLEETKRAFFGPFRVSVMIDSNGANTTAAAAVLAVARHVSLEEGATALVLGATGPVGQRVVRLLACQGSEVHVGSRSADRAAAVCEGVKSRIPGAKLSPHATSTADEVEAALAGCRVVIAAGAAGAQLLSADIRRRANELAVAVDLNAVPPVGIEGIEVTDRAKERDGVVCYGAVGVGGTKMKIHKAAIRRLFDANDQILDAEEIFELGRELADA